MTYPICLVDEAQDLSVARSSMIAALVQSGTVLLAYDEFQCLNTALLPIAVKGWLREHCEPVRLEGCRRTDDAELIDAARAIRDGRAPTPEGRRFKVMATPSVPLAATCLANAIAWRKGGNVAVLTPSRRGGYADSIVACVGAGPLGRQRNGPFAIEWEDGDDEDKARLLGLLGLGERCAVDDALAAINAHAGEPILKGLKDWLLRQRSVRGIQDLGGADIERQIDRLLAHRRSYGHGSKAEFSAMTILRGHCFATAPNVNRLHFIARGASVATVFSGRDIQFENPQNRGRDARLSVAVNGLFPGTWDVRLERDGLISDTFAQPVDVLPAEAAIESLEVIPSLITPCFANNVTANWSVRNTRRIELDIEGGGHAADEPPHCGTRSGSHNYIARAGHMVTLRAFPYGDGPPAVEHRTVAEVFVEQAREVGIYNDSAGSIHPDHFRVWVSHGGALPRLENAGSSGLPPGDLLTISLRDCVISEIWVISEYLLSEWARCHGAAPDPTRVSILGREEFIWYTLRVLGRDAAGSRIYPVPCNNMRHFCASSRDVR